MCPKSSMHSFDVLRHQSSANLSSLRSSPFIEILQVKKWTKEWKVSNEQIQELYRNMQDAYAAAGDSWVKRSFNHRVKGFFRANALQLLLELLGTYTKENASKARNDAHKCVKHFVFFSLKEIFRPFRCIINSINDPNVFIMDHLLLLEPVKILEGENIHTVILFDRRLFNLLRRISVVEHLRLWSFGRLSRFLQQTAHFSRLCRWISRRTLSSRSTSTLFRCETRTKFNEDASPDVSSNRGKSTRNDFWSDWKRNADSIRWRRIVYHRR